MPRKDNNRGRFHFWQVHPIITTAVAVVLVAGLVVGGWFLFSSKAVYVTDGGHVFNDNLAQVEGLIKKENDAVTSSGQPYVSIAVLATMSPQPSVEPIDNNRIRHAIEGTYLAQYESNHANGPTGRPIVPLIRLLLADEGSQETTWSQAVSALENDISSSDHLVAVTGLGISVPNTQAAIQELGRHSVGMVASVLTGDEFTRIPGLVRVASPNTEEVAAGVGFLDSNPEPAHPLPAVPKVWLVQDQNKADNYALSLRDDFTHAIGSDPNRRYEMLQPGTSYDSSLAEAQAVLSGAGQHVCNANADVVYFAGRGVELQGFLTGLTQRSCKADHHLIVVTGSDATGLAGQTGLWSASDNMSVYFAGLAHDGMWTAQPNLANSATTSWFTTRGSGFPSMFPNEYPPTGTADPLADGWGIMFHDGVLTAVTAVHNLYQLHNSLPSAGGVAQELNQVTVPGASGYLCFNSDHNPIGKPTPVLELMANGQLRYVRPFSSTGTAPTIGCQ
jgi:hypothetical protein